MIDGRFDAEFAQIFAKAGAPGPNLGALLHRALICLRRVRP